MSTGPMMSNAPASRPHMTQMALSFSTFSAMGTSAQTVANGCKETAVSPLSGRESNKQCSRYGYLLLERGVQRGDDDDLAHFRRVVAEFDQLNSKQTHGHTRALVSPTCGKSDTVALCKTAAAAAAGIRIRIQPRTSG